jgi:hypothetical protein
MVAGIVPTMIYYGMQIIRPEVFLVSSSVLCALVSLMIGSSWTTVSAILFLQLPFALDEHPRRLHRVEDKETRC